MNALTEPPVAEKLNAKIYQEHLNVPVPMGPHSVVPQELAQVLLFAETMTIVPEMQFVQMEVVVAQTQMLDPIVKVCKV